MDYRLDKFFGFLGFALCTVTTALLFNPSTGHYYFSFGRYIIYLALAFFLVAIVLTWVRSFKLKGWQNHTMALIKTLLIFGVFSIAFTILIASHSGI